MLRDTIKESRINVIYEWSKAKDIWKRKKNGRHCEGFNDFRLKGNERNLISFAGPGHWMWWIGADVKTWTRKTEQKGKKTHTHKQEKSLRRKTRDGFLATVPSTIVYSAWVKCQIGKCQKNDGGPMSLALAKGHHHQKIWKSLLFEIKKVEKEKKRPDVLWCLFPISFLIRRPQSTRLPTPGFDYSFATASFNFHSAYYQKSLE